MQFKYEFVEAEIETCKYNNRTLAEIKISMYNDKFSYRFGTIIHIYKNKNNNTYDTIEAKDRTKGFFEWYMIQIDEVKNETLDKMEFDGQSNFECYGFFNISKYENDTYIMKFNKKLGSIVLTKNELNDMVQVFKNIINDIDKLTTKLD